MASVLDRNFAGFVVKQNPPYPLQYDHRHRYRRPVGGKLLDLLTRRRQLAEENRDWGYRRIQGALSNLGHELVLST
jgi:hypothetical protein